MAVVSRPARAVIEAGQVGARRRGTLAHVFGADHVGGAGPHQVKGTPVYPDRAQATDQALGGARVFPDSAGGGGRRHGSEFGESCLGRTIFMIFILNRTS